MDKYNTKQTQMKMADAIESLAWRDCFAAAPAELGCSVLDVPGSASTLLRAQGVPVPMMNRVIGLGGDAGSDAALPAETLDWIAQAYRDAGVGDFWTVAWPEQGGSALQRQLERRGWQPDPHENWMRFARGLDTAAPAVRNEHGLHIRLATRDDVQVAGEIICRSFGLPDALGPWLGALAGRPKWQVFFACDAYDVPVATGAVFVDGKRAWMGIGATLPEARQQGAQQMLLAARLDAARKAGAVVAAIEAQAVPDGETSHSLSNIHRAGFEEIGLRLNYLCQSA